MVNVDSGLAVDVSGSDVVQYPVSGATSQEWTIVPAGTNGYYTLKNVSAGPMLDVEGASKTNGALLDVWPANTNANQEWEFD